MSADGPINLVFYLLERPGHAVTVKEVMEEFDLEPRTATRWIDKIIYSERLPLGSFSFDPGSSGSGDRPKYIKYLGGL